MVGAACEDHVFAIGGCYSHVLRLCILDQALCEVRINYASKYINIRARF